MIEAFKSEEIVDKFGGRFRLTTVIQRRLVQLMDGARPMVDRQGRSDLEIVVAEIMADKIEIVEPDENIDVVEQAEEALL
ncbi:MAG: DNA-directed RNA polymerase subunit omega [Phycisphaera sp.]|nr:MAG: DNA-directed RNA polymerase subunit omega [Phycisphaera sp.]